MKSKQNDYKRIALIGLDGSGKSANLDLMKKDEFYKDYEFVWVRWKPCLLRPFYGIVNRKIKKKVIIQHSSNAEDSKEYEYEAKKSLKGKIFRNTIVCRIWMFLALIDYLFQFYRKTGRLLLNRKNIVFDRFYLDLFVDQGISFGYSPSKIVKQIQKYKHFFPNITQFIYIRVAPEICYSRKDDIPGRDYLQKRFEIYELLSHNSEWILIDGEQELKKVNETIKQCLRE